MDKYLGARAQFLRRRFLEDVADRRGLAWWRRQRQSMIRGAAQLCYLGFYRDPRVAAVRRAIELAYN